MKISMYGHSAGQPVSSLYTKYYRTCDQQAFINRCLATKHFKTLISGHEKGVGLGGSRSIMKAVQRLTKLLNVPLIGAHIRPCRSSTQTKVLLIHSSQESICSIPKSRCTYIVYTHIHTYAGEFHRVQHDSYGVCFSSYCAVRKYMDPPLYTYSSRYICT